MKKDLQKYPGRKRLTLKLNKETLRLLEAAELRDVEGAGTNSFCFATFTCCQEN